MRSFALLFALAILAGPVFANTVDIEIVEGFVAPTPGAPIWEPSRDVLYDNGPIITHPGGGFGGADASAVQTALGMSLYGFGWQHTVPNRMADDFTIDAGQNWSIEAITFFGYQTGSSTASTYTGCYIEIFDGLPGGAVIFGDMVTNLLTFSEWTGAYRVLDTGMMDTNRPIMAVVCAISPPLVLGPGWYSVAGSATGSLTSGPWTPPVTILGTTATGDAYQYTSTGWNPAMDTGSGAPQGWPFILEGSGGPTPTDDSTWGQVKALFR
jgi:hypothetical protein